MLVKYFTGLEMIDFGIDIHDLPWAESSLRLWMMSQEGNTDVEEVEDLDPSELINVHLLSSHGALKYHAKARLAQHYDKIKQFYPELSVSCTLISPIPALTKDMDKAKEDRQVCIDTTRVSSWYSWLTSKLSMVKSDSMVPITLLAALVGRSQASLGSKHSPDRRRSEGGEREMDR